MTIVSGDNQSARVGTLAPAPLVIRVTDASGAAISDVTVDWKTSGQDGTPSAASTITDASGLSNNKWTLGARIGMQSMTASLSRAGGVSVSFAATALSDAAAPPGRLVFVSAPSDVAVGVAITPPVVVQALDALGRHDSTFTGRVSIDLGPTASGARLQGNPTANAVAGLAVFDRLTLDAPATALTLVASATGVASATSAEFAVTNPPARLKLASGDRQQGKPGAALPSPLVVLVEDSRGNPLSNVSVQWLVASGGGSIAALSTTNALGLASALWTLGGTNGAQSATASVDGARGSPVQFSATAKP